MLLLNCGLRRRLRATGDWLWTHGFHACARIRRRTNRGIIVSRADAEKGLTSLFRAAFLRVAEPRVTRRRVLLHCTKTRTLRPGS
jgi:hypothetical protein